MWRCETHGYTRISRPGEDKRSSASLPLVAPQRWEPSRCCASAATPDPPNPGYARNEPCLCANLLAVLLLLLIRNSYRML
jgi:hypothetical protein